MVTDFLKVPGAQSKCSAKHLMGEMGSLVPGRVEQKIGILTQRHWVRDCWRLRSSFQQELRLLPALAWAEGHFRAISWKSVAHTPGFFYSLEERPSCHLQPESAVPQFVAAVFVPALQIAACSHPVLQTSCFQCLQRGSLHPSFSVCKKLALPERDSSRLFHEMCSRNACFPVMTDK